MAEVDLTETVSIKNESTGEIREVPRGAVPFFPDFVVLKSDGSKNPNPATATPKG